MLVFLLKPHIVPPPSSCSQTKPASRGEMSQQGVQMDKKKLCCWICLDLLKDPVTVPCGHSYCLSCIKSHWDDQKESFSCLQCRQAFIPRPVLVKNAMLADLVEELKRTGFRAAAADHCYAGPEDVACDSCTGSKLKAFKSCLQCLVSYCEQHLQPHYKSSAFENHKLVAPSKKFQENICHRHNEVMKLFCYTDQQSICLMCSMHEHKEHDTVSVTAEMAERQKELETTRQKIQRGIQNREKDVKKLQQEVEVIDQSADKAVEDGEKILADAKQQIRSRQKSQAILVKELQEKLEKEIADLRQKDVELEQLSQTQDHGQFLQNYSKLSRLGEAADSSGANSRPLRYIVDVNTAVSEAKDKLQDVLSEEWTKISLMEPDDVSLLQEEPKSRDDFLKYSRHITLDGTTAHKHVEVMTDRIAKFRFFDRPQYDHPDGFSDWAQVLCTEGLTGRCYWEVELSGRGSFAALTYKSISRAGRESVFGNNDKSWALESFPHGYEFRHKSMRTFISAPWSHRLGVYLDHSAGLLSFYSISDTMTLLHTVQTRFTQPLYAGFGIHAFGASVTICKKSKIED